MSEGAVGWNAVPAFKAGAKVDGRREGLEGFLKFVASS